MIRRLTGHDIPVLLDFMRGAQKEAGWQHLHFAPQHMAQNLAAFIRQSHYLAIGSQPGDDDPLSGFLIASIGSPWYTPTVIASEQVFYVKPAYRRHGGAHELIQHYIEWAEVNGAAETLIGNGLGIQADKVKALCESLGFTSIGFILKQ